MWIFIKAFIYVVENEFTECLQNRPDEILELRQNFEIQKRKIGEDTTNKYLYIPLPECLREVPEIKMKIEGSKKYPGIRVRRGKAEFPLEMIQDLFMEPINDINGQISHLLLDHRDVDAVILVGGFSESQLVYKSIKKRSSHQSYF